MKRSTPFLTTLVFGCATTLCCLTASAAQTPTPSKTPSPAAAAKPDPAVEQEVPRAVFVVPTSPKEGRDPFFPNSTLSFPQAVTKTSPTTAAAPPKMSLMGISGTRERPLAILNGKTFGKGEEQEVQSGNTKLRVRCIDIKEDSVIIDVNGERQELHMRSGL
jgi:hypothetical protein